MRAYNIITKNVGRIDPANLATYKSCGGLKALHKFVETMSPEDAIEEITNSLLRGRGGAGFPTGKKWELARETEADERFLICNADEGEVGTFKDRYLLEKDPFMLLEGIAITAAAIGAKKAFIYLRAEYNSLAQTLHKALEEIGQAIDSVMDLDVEVFLGAGAYVCGEESALIESIEGKRGEARFRPPFPPSAGLFKKPTVINNVETIMNVPHIILHGAPWFKNIGTEKSKGTKVFSVSGDVEKPGVYELVMGTSLKELLTLARAKDVRFAQVGGAAGRIIPEENLDIPLSYETVLGAGAVIVYNKSRDVIEVARKTMEFFEDECCGKCAPCREGTHTMMEILGRFSKGEGTAKDIEHLETLSDTMKLASLCGLGQTAPTVVTDTLAYYREEYTGRMKKKG